MKRELSVLNDKADEDEDDFVRSVELEIDGHPAQLASPFCPRLLVRPTNIQLPISAGARFAEKT